MYRLDDTIGAIATPAGVGGIGIVRVSGPKALDAAGRLFPTGKPLEKKRQLLFGKFKDPQSGEILDEGLLLVMPGPQSYTAEDVVEFHGHGSPSLLAKLMEILAALGVRPAEPGEFTYRAFLNGRLDLTQAEAVEALVSARGDAARRQALSQLTGTLASHLEPLEESLKSLYLKVEARLEFSEDGIPPLDQNGFRKNVAEVGKELLRLLESYNQGKVLREGLKVALVGPPNVGKSSLLNAILGSERAIVTPVPGTTRDVVEGEILLKGVRVRLYDTAGLRDSSNVVEAEGVRRSNQVIEEADVIFWMLDATNPAESLKKLKNYNLPPGRAWFLINKTDLLKPGQSWKDEASLPSHERCLGLSCKTGEGLKDVQGKIEELLQTPAGGENVVLTSIRHKKEVAKACECLENLKGLMDSQQPRELWAEELKEAALAVGRIRGRNLPTSAFEEIFKKFCVGK